MLDPGLRYLSLALASLAVAACAGPRHANVPEQPALNVEDLAVRPELSVEYHPETGQLVVRGDRPMHVAVFAVRGGYGGPRLIFPTRYHRAGKVAPGEHLLLSARYTEGLPRIRLTRADRLENYPHHSTEWGDYRASSHWRVGEPLYIYAIGSIAPLSTETLLERAVIPDHPAFRQNNLWLKLDVVTSRVLTATADSTWADAIQVFW